MKTGMLGTDGAGTRVWLRSEWPSQVEDTALEEGGVRELKAKVFRRIVVVTQGTQS